MDLSKKINNLYNKKGYSARFGKDIYVSIFICLVFFIVHSYFHVFNSLKPIQNDWENQKCHPSVIPFAGFIKKPEHLTALEFTESNFINCTNDLLSTVMSYALAPLKYSMEIAQTNMKLLASAANALRDLFNKIRDSVKEFVEEITDKEINFVTQLTYIVIKIRSAFDKTAGALSASLYTFIGAFFTFKSFFIILINKLTQVLIGLVVTIGIALAISIAAAFFFPPLSATAWGVVAGTIAIMTAITIPLLVIEVVMRDIMRLSSPSPPKIPHHKKPHCFASNTVLYLKNKNKIKICDINVNDVLNDNSTVTGIMKLSSKGQDVYKLNNVFVTGKHTVYHNYYGWINVENHPDSIYIDDFIEPFVYCINTDSKSIIINNTVYKDWDELIEKDLIDLKTNCVEMSLLPVGFTSKDIHYYLDNGFHEDTKIELNDGTCKNINNIQVNDVLRFGEIVMGIVKINANIIGGVNEYTLPNGVIIKCSKNIEFINNNLGINNTNSIRGNKITDVKYLYHLLTNKNSFVIDGMRVADYNYGIEKYLTDTSSVKQVDVL